MIADEIDRLDPLRVVVLGGTSDVSNSTASTIAGGRTVDRNDGGDIFGTSAAIALKFFESPVQAVYLVRSDVIADGVSAGSLQGGPILFVPSCGDLPTEVANAIGELQAIRVIALGGTAAVCDSVLNQAAANGAVGPEYLTADRYLEGQSDVQKQYLVESRVSGTTYRNSFRWTPLCCGNTSVTFDMGRDFERFRGVLGWEDTTDGRMTGTIRILVDGVEVAYHPNVGVGQAVPIDVDVSGGLRLTVARDIPTHWGTNNGFVLGTGRLLAAGATDSLDNPEATTAGT